MESGLVQYYSRRAKEYEEIFNRDDAVRQAEQKLLTEALTASLAGRSVLEVACGTGYWTERIAPVVARLVATDLSQDVLEVLREKQLPPEKVEIIQADAWLLDAVEGTFDGGLANFWFSHIPRSRIAEFLERFHRRLTSGVVVFMADNLPIPGVGGPLARRPDCEDTFKIRTLQDGSRYEVLKNYYSASDLEYLLANCSRNLKIKCGRCFWWVTYETL